MQGAAWPFTPLSVMCLHGGQVTASVFFLTSSRRLKGPVHNHWQRKTKCFTAHVSAISAVGIRKIFAISKKDKDKNNEERYVKSFPDHMANCNFFIFWFQGARLSFSCFFLITRKNKAFLFGFLLLLHIFLPAQSLYLNIFRRTFFFVLFFKPLNVDLWIIQA